MSVKGLDGRGHFLRCIDILLIRSFINNKGKYQNLKCNTYGFSLYTGIRLQLNNSLLKMFGRCDNQYRNMYLEC